MATLVPPFLLGLDPGPRLSGWCKLALDTGQRPLWLDAGRDGIRSLSRLLVDVGRAGGTIVVERVTGYVHEKKRGADLIATAREGGRFVGYCEAGGFPVLELSAEQWRAGVVGKRTPSDAEVKTALGRLVAPPRRSSVHARDACGAALGAALRQGWLVGGTVRKENAR